MKKNNGITLVALVISIIIVIILAEITINALINNGITDKAKTATQEYKNAQDYEEAQIAKYTNEIDKQVKGNRATVTLTDEEYQIFKNQTSFSTDEKIIGKWINGENLYRKVINGGAISSGSYIDLSSYNIDTLVYYYVMFSDVYNNKLAVSSSYKDPWCNIYVTYNIPSSKLNVSYSDFTPTSSVFTIEYTKTTD